MTERIVIRCLALQGIARHPGRRNPAGQYLRAYDPEAHDGQGEARWTADPAKAMVFPSKPAAWALYTAVPTARPTRPDGQPNRPLCAFSISIEPAPPSGLS